MQATKTKAFVWGVSFVFGSKSLCLGPIIPFLCGWCSNLPDVRTQTHFGSFPLWRWMHYRRGEPLERKRKWAILTTHHGQKKARRINTYIIYIYMRPSGISNRHLTVYDLYYPLNIECTTYPFLLTNKSGSRESTNVFIIHKTFGGNQYRNVRWESTQKRVCSHLSPPAPRCQRFARLQPARHG